MRYFHPLAAPASMRQAVERACQERAAVVITAEKQKLPLAEDPVYWVVALRQAGSGQPYFTLEESRAADQHDRWFAFPIVLIVLAVGGLAAFAGVKAQRRLAADGQV